MKNITPTVMSIAPEDYRGFALDSFIKENPRFSMDNLASMGITMDESILRDPKVMETVKSYAKAMTGDAAELVMGAASAVTPLQFAQFWLPDVINALYRGRTMSRIFGSSNVGTWETEQIVATKLERTGKPALYDDFSKAPLANWNIGFETLDNIRFEIGIECTKLEEARAAQMKQNAYQMKRSAAILGMDVLINQVKLLGYSDGTKKVYGVINAPAISGRIGNAAFDPAASATTAENIIAMLNTWIQTAADDLQGNWNAEDELVIVLPLAWQTAFTKVNQYNLSPRKWLAENYPKVKIEVSPEFSTADAGDPMAMVYVRRVADVGDTLTLMDTSKLRLVGAVPTVKGFEESYSSSTAGALYRCPLAVRFYAKP